MNLFSHVNIDLKFPVVGCKCTSKTLSIIILVFFCLSLLNCFLINLTSYLIQHKTFVIIEAWGRTQYFNASAYFFIHETINTTDFKVTYILLSSFFQSCRYFTNPIDINLHYPHLYSVFTSVIYSYNFCFRTTLHVLPYTTIFFTGTMYWLEIHIFIS